jgi:hypothetical protein
VVQKQSALGFLVSPAGGCYISPFFLLAAVLDSQKSALGKKSVGNTRDTIKAFISPESARGCGVRGYDKALGSSAYAWVDEDRMASVSGPGVNVSYEYDADGLGLRRLWPERRSST